MPRWPKKTADTLAWGARVSGEFRSRVRAIANELDVDPNHLMACMYALTAGKFKADYRNTGTGLIQFTPDMINALGVTGRQFVRLAPEDQLYFVRDWLMQYKGAMDSIGDVYTAMTGGHGIGLDEQLEQGLKEGIAA